MYATGRGVPKDYTAALSWYRKAADQGDASAQNNLGSMYAAGRGVPQDHVQAFMWYTIAAARFPADEAGNRAKAVKGCDSEAAKMTHDEIAEAQRLAREWRPK
jgi:TPR repeat protein